MAFSCRIMKRCRNLTVVFWSEPCRKIRCLPASVGELRIGMVASAIDTPSGRLRKRVTAYGAKPAGGGLPKDEPSRSKNKPQRGQAQERREPGRGVTAAAGRRARLRVKAERRRNSRSDRAKSAVRPMGSNHHVGPGRQECRSTASAEQPLKGEAQERSRPEIRPAKPDREQSVERVAKPWGRTRSGQVKPAVK